MPVRRSSRAAAVLCAGVLCALISGLSAAQGIYVCTDGKGRRITADRPIADCVDREQQELGRSGTVVRKLGPTLTAKERADQEMRERSVAAEQARAQDEKRRERALLLRYPNVTVHERERNASLATVDELIALSHKRADELVRERKLLDGEMEFYAKDPGKAPFGLKNRLESNRTSMVEQQTFTANQTLEKKRINQRFDDDLVKLKILWARNAALPDR